MGFTVTCLYTNTLHQAVKKPGGARVFSYAMAFVCPSTSSSRRAVNVRKHIGGRATLCMSVMTTSSPIAGQPVYMCLQPIFM
jgi:hypothetical protein